MRAIEFGWLVEISLSQSVKSTYLTALLLFSDSVVEGFLQWVLNESWEAEKTLLEGNLEINKSRPSTDYLTMSSLEIRLNFRHV
jgi:hypothetical protein